MPTNRFQRQWRWQLYPACSVTLPRSPANPPLPCTTTLHVLRHLYGPLDTTRLQNFGVIVVRWIMMIAFLLELRMNTYTYARCARITSLPYHTTGANALRTGTGQSLYLPCSHIATYVLTHTLVCPMHLGVCCEAVLQHTHWHPSLLWRSTAVTRIPL